MEFNELTEKIKRPEYLEYLKVNEYSYFEDVNAKYKQGLFLLGVLMNEINRIQKEKKNAYRVLDKIDLFTNMSKNNVKSIINNISEFLTIYKKRLINSKKEETIKLSLLELNESIFLAMLERLTDIERSTLKNDDIPFYILTGKSLAEVVTKTRIKKRIEEKMKEQELNLEKIGKWYFRGSSNNWNAVEMALTKDKLDELKIIQDFTNVENPRFKISKDMIEWNESYPENDFVLENKKYEIIFNVFTKEIIAIEI